MPMQSALSVASKGDLDCTTVHLFYLFIAKDVASEVYALLFAHSVLEECVAKRREIG